MANFNRVILAGNITRDPELRYTPKGTAVTKITLAVNRVYTTESGEKKEEVTFVDVDAFARQAEVISQYLKKGRPVLVEGRLRQETWDDKATGQKRSKLSVMLENFQFLDSGRGERSAPPSANAGSSPAPVAAPVDQAEPAPAEDDVPF